MSSGKVWLVGAGPGTRDLITVRGWRVLQAADAVLYDALSHPGLLEFCRSDADVRNVGKRGGLDNPSQEWITSQLIELARAGKRVVRLKGGDPFLFARGAEEAEALAEAGISFEVVPGISSPVGTTAYAGIPLTHRGLSNSVTFITGTESAGQEWSPDAWQKLATATSTICILMGMRRLGKIAQALIAGGRDARTPTAVVQWGARPKQVVVTTTLGEVASVAIQRGLSNPAVVIVGEVVALRQTLAWYDKQPLFSKRLLLPRPEHQAAESASAILDRGAEPVVFPTIEITAPPEPERVDQAIQELGAYDWCLFTSANGVERFFERLRATGKDSRALGPCKVGVIGPKTALALERYGIRPDAVATEFLGEGLARAVLEVGTPRRVLIPRALVARDELPRLLTQSGARVDVVPVYATQAVSSERASRLVELFENEGLDVALFTSSSTVQSLMALLGERAAALLAKVTVASIGPITTQTLVDAGVRVDVTAHQFTVEGLLDALESHFGKSTTWV